MPLVVYCQEHFLTPCPSNMHTHMLTRGNASILGLEKLYATSSKKPSLTPKLDEVPFTGLSAPVLTCVPAPVTFIVNLIWHACHPHQTVNSSEANLVCLILGPRAGTGFCTEKYPE